MSGERHILPVGYANDTGIFTGVICNIHRHIVSVMGYCWAEQSDKRRQTCMAVGKLTSLMGEPYRSLLLR
jgi:hypothetical protein